MSVAETVALPPVEFTPQNYKVSTLVMRIEAGEIALPEFQRDFLWQPPAIADLLRTVARQWPAGTFLVLEVEDKPAFAFKALKNAPPTDKPKILILDGQQRTTALFHALTDIAGETYFVAMGEIAEAGEFEDDHLRFLKTARFAREYPNVDALAKAKIVKIATLANDLAFNQWCRYLTDAEQDQMLQIRQELLPGLREYDIPAVRLPSDVPLAAIAKIFETLNRTGMRLATFDLMVARLYPYDFKLRDEWEAARANCDQFDDLGIEDGVEVLKVIALREHMRQRDANIKLTVKGVRESDVLALAPQTVIDQWADAVQALANAIDFVGSECGAIRKGLMPSSAMLLPLAHMLAPGSAQREGLRADLVRWFWATSFAQTYAQGANTQAVADTRILSAWQADQAAMPDAVRLFRLDSETTHGWAAPKRDARAGNPLPIRHEQRSRLDRGQAISRSPRQAPSASHHAGRVPRQALGWRQGPCRQLCATNGEHEQEAPQHAAKGCPPAARRQPRRDSFASA